MDGVRAQIRETFEAEGPSGWLAVSLRMVLTERGVGGAELDLRVERASGFVHRYVEVVPDVLEGIERSAAAAGVAGEVASVIAAAKAYFEATADFIPDHNGVAGLVDDAYLAMSLVERFSAAVREEEVRRGVTVPLGAGVFDLPTSRANAAVRAMIGEPLATQLDGAVSAVLALAEVRAAIAALGGRGVRLSVDDVASGTLSDVAGLGE